MFQLQLNPTPDNQNDAGIFLLIGTGWVLFVCCLVWAIRLKAKQRQLEAQLMRSENRRLDIMVHAEKVDHDSNRAKDTFLAHISHVLRTPLNVIIGYAELMAEICSEKKFPDILADIRKIRLAGLQLLNSVEDMLSLTQVEAGKIHLHITRISTRKLVDEVVALVKPELGDNQLNLSFEDPPEKVDVDVDKLKDVLSHLLFNAARYTHDGEIGLTVRPSRIENRDAVSFIVSDTGRGIPKGLMSDLFSGFRERGRMDRPENAGIGLGLTVCRRFTQLMGGAINVESHWGEGSRFEVQVPQKTSWDAHSPEAGASRTILVLGHNQGVISDIAAYLEKSGFRVLTPQPGQESLTDAPTLPDLIIVDSLMPENRGRDLLQKLGDDPLLNQIPLLLLTMVDTISMAYNHGVLGYLLKPIEESVLLGLLDHHLGNRKEKPILIVEDDRVTRHMMKQALERAGWSVSSAKTAEEGLALARQKTPALALLDVMLPEISGYDLFLEMRRCELLASLPVLFVSAGSVSEVSRLRLNGTSLEIVHCEGDYRDERFLGILEQKVLARMYQENPKM